MSARRRKPNNPKADLRDQHQLLLSRRRFLIASAGGCVASLFKSVLASEPSTGADAGTARNSGENHWQTMEAVLNHLLPSEPDAPGAPGAREINASAYLKQVVNDPKVDSETRLFLVQGLGWLDGIAREHHQTGFAALEHDARESVLRRVAASRAGENWLSTVLTYLFEALLTDPVYGGNTDQRGWQWLQHTPGYPRPVIGKRHFELAGANSNLTEMDS